MELSISSLLSLCILVTCVAQSLAGEANPTFISGVPNPNANPNANPRTSSDRPTFISGVPSPNPIEPKPSGFIPGMPNPRPRGKPDVECCADKLVRERKNDASDVLTKTLFLYKASKTSKSIKVDNIIPCVNRNTPDSCLAVKWQYYVDKNNVLKSEMWGYIEDKSLLYVGEDVQYASEKFYVFKSTVTNVMTADDKFAASAKEYQNLATCLNDEYYVILEAEWEMAILFQTCAGPESVTYVAVLEEYYVQKDKAELDETIGLMLKANKIDVTTLNTFTTPFDVDTNQIVSVLSDGKLRYVIDILIVCILLIFCIYFVQNLMCRYRKLNPSHKPDVGLSLNENFNLEHNIPTTT